MAAVLLVLLFLCIAADAIAFVFIAAAACVAFLRDLASMQEGER
jgi:hypothetical protein